MNHLLKVGPLTPMDALQKFGSFRLAAHIEVLRKEGHPIHTTMIKENGKEFARYTYRKEKYDQPNT